MATYYAVASEDGYVYGAFTDIGHAIHTARTCHFVERPVFPRPRYQPVNAAGIQIKRAASTTVIVVAIGEIIHPHIGNTLVVYGDEHEPDKTFDIPEVTLRKDVSHVWLGLVNNEGYAAYLTLQAAIAAESAQIWKCPINTGVDAKKGIIDVLNWRVQ